MHSQSNNRKSALVSQIKKPLTDLNGCFIEGKFHRDGTRPDSILASALNSFFGLMLEAASAGNTFTSMKWRIHDAIGSGNNGALMEILPNLQSWLADGGYTAERLAPSFPDLSPSAKGIGSSNRLKFMFCKLIGAIASKSHPVVLFLDGETCSHFLTSPVELMHASCCFRLEDLQWADEMTVRHEDVVDPAT